MAQDAVMQRIVDAALGLAEQRGWDAVHLHEVATAAGLTMAELRAHVEHKDAIAEAWFDRADAAVLALPQQPGWDTLQPRERVQRTLWAWFDALSPHRRLTAAMLRYKLQPEHIHLQALGVMRISRTVQWMREVARLPGVGWRRELEDAALTSI
jgi:ubiquinone biosynthesis protein COQ9